VSQNYDFVTPGGKLGGVNGCIVSLCAAVGEERFFQTA